MSMEFLEMDNIYYWIALYVFLCILLIVETVLYYLLKSRLKRKFRDFEYTAFNKDEEYIQEFISSTEPTENNEYETLYLQPSKTTARNGKNVNIRSEFHDKISSIICMFPERKITISGYIDHVLEHHFKTHHNKIISLIRQKGCRINIWK